MSDPAGDLPDVVLRGRVVTPGVTIPDGLVAISGTRIAWVGPADDAPIALRTVARAIGTTLLPGLIDLHCHGGAGHSFPDGDLDGSRTAALHHLAHGTTGMVASMVTAPEESMITALAAAADLVDEGVVAGIHVEGPFLAPARCGAQDAASMRLPDLRLLDRLLDPGRGHVVSMTYAAELDGASGLVERLTSRGVIPSLGHTDADASTASASLSDAAARAPTGLASVTHLFNGMRPFHHRDPGPAAASLTAAGRGEAVLEMIADGVHLADPTVAMVLELVGPGSVALVTDSVAGAGMPDGWYLAGSRTVAVDGAAARLVGADGVPGTLVGSTMRLLDIVRRCVQLVGIDLAVAVEAAGSTPARLLGIDGERGSLRAGFRADVVAVDDDLRPMAVWTAGRRVDAQT